MKKITYIFSIILFVTNSGCRITDTKDQFMDVDVYALESAKKEYKKRASQRTLTLMSLETMFPDENSRALAKAAGKGKVKKVEELVRSGVDVDAIGAKGATPLFWAMSNFKGFKKLLELGADPNIVYEDGNTVINMAVRLNNSKILTVLLEHGANPNLKTGSPDWGQSMERTPIFSALSRGKSRVDLLLNAGADINAQDSFGYTPVMSVAARADYEMVYYLLEKGADYRIMSDEGDSLAQIVANKIGMLKPKSDEAKWQAKVIEWLEIREVHVR